MGRPLAFESEVGIVNLVIELGRNGKVRDQGRHITIKVKAVEGVPRMHKTVVQFSWSSPQFTSFSTTKPR